VAALTAACGPGGYGTAGGAAPPAAGWTSGAGSAPAPSTVPAAVALATRSGPLGTVLTDPAGHSVYLFGKDTGTTSTCAGACAQVWPPELTTPATGVGAAVVPGLVGTTRRTDGSLQVTYAGHPLYRYAGDSAPGETNGEGLRDFGAGWYLVTPQGTTVGHE
jgi:predicted lipoprotein with Yx(FWY)xxD motif